MPLVIVLIDICQHLNLPQDWPLWVFCHHKQMHLTLKKEATKPSSYNFLQQQGRFDEFMEICNNESSHHALGGQHPDEVYTPSVQDYRPAEKPTYPSHDKAVKVTKCGRICRGRRKVNLSTVFGCQVVGIREVADKTWLAGRPYPSFMDYDPGFFDRELNKVEPVGKNPFVPKVLPMLSAGGVPQ
jgi:putative transposase